MNIDMVLRFIPPDGEFENATPDADHHANSATNCFATSRRSRYYG